MNRGVAIVIPAIIFFSLAKHTDAAGITMTQWNLGTSISLPSIGNINETIFSVLPMLDKTHHITVGSMFAETDYLIEWNQDGGNFDYGFDHRIEDGAEFVEVRSSGTIIFTTDVDVLLDYDFSYTYSLFGPFILRTSLDVIGGTVPPPTVYVQYDDLGGGGALEPPTGTFATSGQVLLPANDRYRITYGVRHNAGENTGAIGTGSGSLHYSLTAVPEPATLILLLMFVPMMSRQPRPGGNNASRECDSTIRGRALILSDPR